MKKKEVVKILEENKLTNIYPTTTNNVVGERIKVDDLSEPVKDFLEVAQKEQRELDESMKESFRQRDERKAKEYNLGNVDFLKEGKYIMCSKCLDNTPHIPAWGICQRCGTQYTTSLKVKTESEKMQEELEPLPFCPMADD